MKVLLIDVNCKKGSTGKIVYDLYEQIVGAGHEAVVCYGRGEKINEKNIYKFAYDIETYLHAFLTRVTGITGCFSFFSTQRLINYIKKFQPDVVHIHELHAYFVNLKPLLEYLKKNHIKTVMTLHCEFAYTGKCGYAYDCEKWKKECKNCQYLHEYVSTLFFDHTSYMFNQKKKIFSDFEDLVITVPSRWLADRVKYSFLKDKEIKVIHNGVNTSVFHPIYGDDLREKLQIPKEYKVVIMVAPNVIDERKGGKWVLELAERMIGEKYVFLFVGDGAPTNYSKANVRFVGPIYKQDVLAKYYSMADYFILCSEKETYSMTCAEAICCDTPVIGFKCGAPETVFDRPYARFVEYGDLNSLMNVLHDEVKIANIGEYGKDNYSVEIMGKKFIELYEMMIRR